MTAFLLAGRFDLALALIVLSALGLTPVAQPRHEIAISLPTGDKSGNFSGTSRVAYRVYLVFN